MKRYRSNFVLLVVIGFQALLAAYALRAPNAALRKRALPYLGPKTYLTYQQLKDGEFMPDGNLRPTGPLTRGMYEEQVFHRGMPMYLGGRNGYDLQKLQRAYTDFDKIHVVAPYQSGQSHLTIIKKQEGPRALEASEKVSARANNVLAVRKTFGHTAAVAAYGQKLESAPHRRGFPGTRRYSLPNWDKAEKAIPLPEETGLQAARDQLNSQRYVAFSSSNNSAKLGIRLLEDGTQEVKWFVNSAPVFVPHP